MIFNQKSDSAANRLPTETTTPVVVITGAASGIGLALAQKCAEQGKHVVMADIAAEQLANEATRLRCSSTQILEVVCNVARYEEVEQLANIVFDTFGKVDWLINNAGIAGPFVPVWELEPEALQQVLNVNLFGNLHGIRAFLPRMLKQNHRSKIINMASVYGLCSGSLLSAYAISKHAVISLSESLYFDLKRLEKPIDVAVICPSFANTNLLKSSSDANSFNTALNELIQRSRPALEVADSILKGIEDNHFYILPDKEVKNYCENKTAALMMETHPPQHNLERLIKTLFNRIGEPVSGL